MHQNVEQETVQRTATEVRLHEIDTALHRANLRRKAYVVRGDERSAWIEETVIDRRLRERKIVTG